jgi:stage II sporulation protein D
MNERGVAPSLLFILVVILIAGCVEDRTLDVPSHRYLDGPPTVRVVIAEEADSVSLTIPEGCWIIRGGKVLKSQSTQPAAATAKKNRVFLGGKDTGFRIVTMVSPDGPDILVNGRGYPGQMALVAERGKLSAVNTVDIEVYVAGVVAGEVPLSWDQDALNAQAVAARSYALYEKKKWAGERSFDLYADERSQMYTGVTKDPKALQAASDTRGVVLLSQWKLFPTYYHAACGGQTRKAFPDFEPQRFTPLVGVACPHCGFKDTRWNVSLTGEQLASRLGISGAIRAIKARDTRRGAIVTVAHPRGSVDFPADEFRRLLGRRKLRSWRFAVRRSSGKWTFGGKGHGHGVGMCQWGACGMANKGYAWQSIIRHYYPGAEAIRVYY